jgi:ring-1,2-phenylacetyl-CoA epoxidase subunit PaaC
MINDHLLQFTLHLADNALIIGHRNSEWCGHGPVLEQDIALSNISLDYIGQARNFYQYAAQLQGNGATEDSLAYLRNAEDFKNCLLVEMPNGDWAQTIVREFLFSTYQYFLYEKLQISDDQQLSAIAEKALKEVTYHVRWSSEWVIRLGDGTEESKQRMEKAIEALWPYTNEFFIPTSFEKEVLVQSFGFDLSTLQATWNKKVTAVFEEATLCIPDHTTNKIGGKEGMHTEYLTSLLEEMQFLQRTNPGAEW